MSRYIIEGGNPLEGSIDVKAAKNSVLPLLAACILTEDKVTLRNCPDISDITNMLKIMINIGCVVERDDMGNITVDSSDIYCGEVPCVLAKELRSSIFLMGPMLSRVKKAKISYPGGCEIGMRPIDIHLSGLRELNIDINEEYGYLDCDASKAEAAQIVLDLPSVGATENLMMASVFLEGKTVLRNCAKEPEIADLQNFLNLMGAKISGAGSSVIVIEGVKKLHGVEYTPIPDRIIAGTYIIAAAMCSGNVELRGVVPEHIYSLIAKLSKTACKIYCKNDKIIVKSKGRLRSLDRIDTMYYPGFPTDMQTQMLALQTISKGTSVIVENIFETRYKTVPEFKKMGADITVRDRTAIVRGVSRLKGAEVCATDLRGGASLVLAGLAAEGITEVKDIYHIDRGYEDMSRVLAELGAKIERSS
ncbi:MAG: UDP-N-acetylglucosamine 1-carboxyvinyltransferase [Clostridia bacterium]|nr:UDP-N-acetylglucosamine 1-carboxyvinyltransferase [Clostridia bacterium]